MKTVIYATPFDPKTLETTGHSVPSGFESLQQVLSLLHDGLVKKTPRMLIYGDSNARIVYSKNLTFSVDPNVSKDYSNVEIE